MVGVYRRGAREGAALRATIALLLGAAAAAAGIAGTAIREGAWEPEATRWLIGCAVTMIASAGATAMTVRRRRRRQDRRTVGKDAGGPEGRRTRERRGRSTTRG